jgi:CheY-like chemotaxis protein
VDPARILLVEDDDDTRQLLAVAMEAAGYHVDQAPDGHRGLEQLRTHRYAVVLTDYDLPGMTGAAMLREAEERGLLDGASSLVVTAHPDLDDVAPSEIVSKPLDLDRFLAQVQGLVRRARRPAAEDGPGRQDTASGGAMVELCLYVSATSAASMKARRNLEALLSRYPAGEVAFAVVDVAAEPAAAERDHIVFTPTLVKREPPPVLWILGDLSQRSVLSDVLDTCGVEPFA